MLFHFKITLSLSYSLDRFRNKIARAFKSSSQLARPTTSLLVKLCLFAALGEVRCWSILLVTWYFSFKVLVTDCFLYTLVLLFCSPLSLYLSFFFVEFVNVDLFFFSMTHEFFVAVFFSFLLSDTCPYRFLFSLLCRPRCQCQVLVRPKPLGSLVVNFRWMRLQCSPWGPEILKGQIWCSIVRMRGFGLTAEYRISVLLVSKNNSYAFSRRGIH